MAKEKAKEKIKKKTKDIAIWEIKVMGKGCKH
jgi:hypothetical protein